MLQLTKIVFMFLIIFTITNCNNNEAKPDMDNDTNKKELSDNINDIKVKNVIGDEVQLSDYNGKVLLIVNVASECGYTYQYESLQKLYNNYKDKNFEVLAFPCNDFGGQEPGTNEEIKEFCSSKFGVEFTLFDKVKVLGNEKADLYKRLTNNSVTPSADIKWNFEKFLISKEGKIIGRFGSKIEPDSEEIISQIEKLL